MVDEEGKKVLAALAGFENPASGKQIAEASGVDSKVVTNKIKSLKKNGLVDSPVRCKYCVTDAGRKEI
jgi:predicted transcriptional regulator